ncbi:MAG: hypothetical protein E7252_00065 [Lachnospira sp.]|nr:hypothetical protein [Lachnospira sp.]
MKKKKILLLILTLTMLMGTVTVFAESKAWVREGKVNSDIYLDVWMDRDDAPFWDFNQWRFRLYGENYYNAISDLNAGFEYYPKSTSSKKVSVWYCQNENAYNVPSHAIYDYQKTTYKITTYVKCTEFDFEEAIR